MAEQLFLLHKRKFTCFAKDHTTNNYFHCIRKNLHASLKIDNLTRL